MCNSIWLVNVPLQQESSKDTRDNGLNPHKARTVDLQIRSLLSCPTFRFVLEKIMFEWIKCTFPSRSGWTSQHIHAGICLFTFTIWWMYYSWWCNKYGKRASLQDWVNKDKKTCCTTCSMSFAAEHNMTLPLNAAFPISSYWFVPACFVFCILQKKKRKRKRKNQKKVINGHLCSMM